MQLQCGHHTLTDQQRKFIVLLKLLLIKQKFSFARRPEKMVFLKKSGWNMIFLVLSGKMIFLFPENMILLPERKMKDDLSQKNTWKCDDIFFKCSEKMVFSKIALEYDLSCIIWKDGIFFPKIYFFLGKKMKDDLSQGIHGNMIFSLYTHRRHKHSTVPLLQKKSKMILPSKNASTGGWHSRLTSYKKFQYFSVLLWRPLQAFSHIPFQRKKQET